MFPYPPTTHVLISSIGRSDRRVRERVMATTTATADPTEVARAVAHPSRLGGRTRQGEAASTADAAAGSTWTRTLFGTTQFVEAADPHAQGAHPQHTVADPHPAADPRRLVTDAHGGDTVTPRLAMELLDGVHTGRRRAETLPSGTVPANERATPSRTLLRGQHG